MFLTVGKTKVSVILGDIIEQDVTVIVNSANPRLSPGGGISGYIHKKAGGDLYVSCKDKLQALHKKYLEAGEPIITTGGALKQKILHVVGPKFHIHKEGWKDLLIKVYANSLHLAKEEGFKKIAFPSISTGAYGCPISEASMIAIDTTRKYIEANPDTFEEIVFVLFTTGDYDMYLAGMGTTG